MYLDRNMCILMGYNLDVLGQEYGYLMGYNLEAFAQELMYDIGKRGKIEEYNKRECIGDYNKWNDAILASLNNEL